MGEKSEKSKAEKLYDILQNDQHYKDVLPDKETFINKLQDEKFASKFHSILMNDNRYNTVIPEYNSFYKSMQIPVSATESKADTEVSEITEPTDDFQPDEFQKKFLAERKWILDHLEEVKQATKDDPEKYDRLIAFYKDGIWPRKRPNQESAAEVSVRDKVPVENEATINANLDENINAIPNQPSAAEVSVRDKTPMEMIPSLGMSPLNTNSKEEGISKIDASIRKPSRDETEKWNLNRQLADLGVTEDEFKKKGGLYNALTDKIYYPENKGFEIDNIIENLYRNPVINDNSHLFGYATSNKYKEQLNYRPDYARKMEIKGTPEKTIQGLNDKEFVDLMLSQREDPEYGASGKYGKISDEDIIQLLIDRQKRKASGYFDTKYNRPSEVHSSDLESMNKENCENCWKKQYKVDEPAFDKYNKQAIIETYKVLNPGKTITPEMEKVIDEKLNEKQKNRNLQSK